METAPVAGDPHSEQQGYNVWKHDLRDSVLAMDLLRYHFVNKKVGGRKLDILDFGCGDGYLSFLSAQKGHCVTAVDVNSVRMERFTEMAKKHHV